MMTLFDRLFHSGFGGRKKKRRNIASRDRKPSDIGQDSLPKIIVFLEMEQTGLTLLYLFACLISYYYSLFLSLTRTHKTTKDPTHVGNLYIDLLFIYRIFLLRKVDQV